MERTVWASIIAIPVIAVGLIKYRSDYRRLGRTTPLAVQLLLLAFFMPNLVMATVVPWFSYPQVWYDWLGTLMMLTTGGVLCWWFVVFGPLKRWVGMETAGLVTTGLFRYTRHPGYLSWLIFLTGYALTGREWLALWPIVLYCGLMHAMALIEEEHLIAVFGDEYLEYMHSTPRYLII